MSDDFRCGTFVVHRIHQLTGSLPGRLTPWARGMLAQLRQAAPQKPGTAPAIWPLTAEGLPDLRPDQQRFVETAIHVALTEFAIHQQARPSSMHNPRQPFGLAVRRLAESDGREGDPYETPVYRRFTAMLTATHIDGLLAHSRGLVTQMRGADIAFDYGGYADALYWFQKPGHAAAVRRQWGRDFHRLGADTTNHIDTPVADTTTEGAPE